MKTLKKSGVAVLISDKVAFRAKEMTRDREHYHYRVMLKGQSTKNYSNLTCSCTKYHSCKICEAKL